jgi:hypothetical protein
MSRSLLLGFNYHSFPYHTLIIAFSLYRASIEHCTLLFTHSDKHGLSFKNRSNQYQGHSRWHRVQQ